MPLNPSTGLLLQFLSWVAARERRYGETMDAWRTSCPRISVWEDALADELVEVDVRGAGTQAEGIVSLTQAGRALLDRAASVPQ